MGTWYNWPVEKVKMIDDEALLQEAISFRKSVQKGEAKAVVEDHGEKAEDAPF